MFLDDIARLLQDNGAGVIGKDLSTGWWLDKINCVAIFEYAGQPPEVLNGVHIEHPGLQVKVRDKSYAVGRERCQLIQDTLHAVCNEVVGGSYYTTIRANQSPTPLGRTPNDEYEFVQNFTVGMKRL